MLYLPQEDPAASESDHSDHGQHGPGDTSEDDDVAVARRTRYNERTNERRKEGRRTREKAREKEQLLREGESAQLNKPWNQQ